MAASREEIDRWYDQGIAKGARHMLVICDTFSYDDYPVYTHNDKDCLDFYKSPGDMQRVMEVYDLQADKAAQMAECRAMHLPKDKPAAPPSAMPGTYHYDAAPDDNAALILDAEGATQFEIRLPGQNKGAGAIARQLAQLLTLAQAIGSEGLTGFHTLTRVLASPQIDATISHRDTDGHRLLLTTPGQQLGAALTLASLTLPEDRRVDRLTRELSQIATALGLPTGTDGPGILAHITRYTRPETRHAHPA